VNALSLQNIQGEDINFWRPGGGRGFAVIDPGELFLFKLHAPLHAIVGGGIFRRFAAMSLGEAWHTFRERNGVSSLNEMRRLVAEYRRIEEVDDAQLIGCVVLARSFFWRESQWLKAPNEWAPNIVQGRSYDLHTPPGSQLWASIVDRDPGVQEQATEIRKQELGDQGLN
jgi:putative restriction endonuclease